jgi:hypothetical protein
MESCRKPCVLEKTSTPLGAVKASLVVEEARWDVVGGEVGITVDVVVSGVDVVDCCSVAGAEHESTVADATISVDPNLNRSTTPNL